VAVVLVAAVVLVELLVAAVVLVELPVAAVVLEELPVAAVVLDELPVAAVVLDELPVAAVVLEELPVAAVVLDEPVAAPVVVPPDVVPPDVVPPDVVPPAVVEVLPAVVEVPVAVAVAPVLPVAEVLVAVTVPPPEEPVADAESLATVVPVTVAPLSVAPEEPTDVESVALSVALSDPPALAVPAVEPPLQAARRRAKPRLDHRSRNMTCSRPGPGVGFQIQLTLFSVRGDLAGDGVTAASLAESAPWAVVLDRAGLGGALAFGLVAALGGRILAEANLAVLGVTGVAAGLDLGGALGTCVQVRQGTVVSPVQEDVLLPAGGIHGAAPEAIAPVGGELGAEIDALLCLRGLIVAVVAPGVLATDVCARVGGIAFQVPVAAIVALTTVSVEEAVLLAVHVVAGNARGKRALIVVAGPRTLRIVQIEQPVSVVVQAVGARVDLASAVHGASSRTCARIRGGAGIRPTAVGGGAGVAPGVRGRARGGSGR
jgi:hypothetical protein